MARYAFFWGCQFPARYPAAEQTARRVCEKIGIDIVDLDGFTCCPEKALVKNQDKLLWYIAAARNLAVVEESGLDLVSICNGCYSTLKTVRKELLQNTALREQVNATLARVGRKFTGTSQVWHFMEILHDKIGPAEISSQVTRPLVGMRIVPHYGCHLLQPSSDLMVDDPQSPAKFEALIKALGAETPETQTLSLCCGGALGNVGNLEGNLDMTRRKLENLRDVKVDAMTTFCPSCFLQYDTKQSMLQRRGEKLHTPVLFFFELMALAFNMDVSESLKQHRVSADPFIGALDEREGALSELEAIFDIKSMLRCYNCGACVADCPECQLNPSFNPNQIMGKLLAGKLEEVLVDENVWYCVECHTCTELCPQRYGMENVLTTLKQLANERDLAPETVKKAFKVFLKTARLGDPNARQRAKLGMPEAGTTAVDELSEIVKHINEQKGNS